MLYCAADQVRGEQRRERAGPEDGEQPAVPPQVRRVQPGAGRRPRRQLAGVEPEHRRRPRREHELRPDPQLQDQQRRRLRQHRRRLLGGARRERHVRARPRHQHRRPGRARRAGVRVERDRARRARRRLRQRRADQDVAGRRRVGVGGGVRRRPDGERQGLHRHRPVLLRCARRRRRGLRQPDRRRARRRRRVQGDPRHVQPARRRRRAGALRVQRHRRLHGHHHDRRRAAAGRRRRRRRRCQRRREAGRPVLLERVRGDGDADAATGALPAGRSPRVAARSARKLLSSSRHDMPLLLTIDFFSAIHANL